MLVFETEDSRRQEEMVGRVPGETSLRVALPPVIMPWLTCKAN